MQNQNKYYHFMCLECNLEWVVEAQNKEQFEMEFEDCTDYAQSLCTCKRCSCSDTAIMNEEGEHFNGTIFTE